MSGDLASLNIFNLITGSALFGISVFTINVSFSGSGTPDLMNATLLTLALSNLQLSVGAGSFGLAITGGNLGIAAITAPNPSSGATDDRTWIAVDASGISGSLTLGTAVSASVSNLAIQINEASGQYTNGQTTTPAAALDWTNDLETPGTTTYGVAINPGASCPVRST